MRKDKISIKIGIFTFFAIVIFFAITLSLNKFLFLKTCLIKIRFSDASGLERGNFILLSGVKIGIIKEIKITGGKYPVLVIGQIDKKAKIYDDYDIRIISSGIIGEKIISIRSGFQSKKLADLSKPLIGKSAESIDITIIKFNNILQKVEKTVNSINEIISNRQFKKNVLQITENIKNISSDLKTFSKESFPKISENLSKITEILQVSKTALVQSAEEFRMTNVNIRKNISLLSSQLKKSIKNIDRRTSIITQKVSTASDKVSRSSDDFDEIITDIKNKKGNLYYLIYDDTLYINANGLIFKLKRLFSKTTNNILPSWEYEIK